MARPTLREVARQAGVSLGTASQALNDRPGVARETRVRVLNAAASLGYFQHARPALVEAHPLAVIGLLGKYSAGEATGIDPFYSQVLAGVEHECRRQGVSLMYATVEVDEHNRPVAWPPMLAEQRVDGLIVAGAFIEDTLAAIGAAFGAGGDTSQWDDTVRQAPPVALVDAYSYVQPFDSVVIDNFDGAYTAVSYLVERGHTCIGLIGSERGAYPSVLERREGYLRALEHNDIGCTFIEDGPLTRPAGTEATLRLLERCPQVTAIFACNDDVAIGVLNAAAALGRRVPDDLSVIGFDDIDLAQEIDPPLTTMHVDKVLMGVLAVRHLLDRAHNPDRPTLTTSISPQLIVRDSVRHIPVPLPCVKG